jgi:HPt (histidine-containing phosphotransfer) domain-containing protein
VKNRPITEILQAAGPQPFETNWNLPELLERLDHDREFLLELLTIFRQDSQDAIGELQNALSNRDLVTSERKAHTLKGMLRNLLMDSAAQLASELEHAARNGKPQDCTGPLARLETALEQLSAEVDVQMQRAKS